jgi:hypothetical protein
VFRKFNGRLLSADEHPLVLEGASAVDPTFASVYPRIAEVIVLLA